MYKIVVKENGTSNLPVDVFDINSDPDDILKMIMTVLKNPDRYRFEFEGSFTWSAKCSFHFISFVKPIMEMIKRDGGVIDLPLLFGFLQGISLAENEQEGSVGTMDETASYSKTDGYYLFSKIMEFSLLDPNKRGVDETKNDNQG